MKKSVSPALLGAAAICYLWSDLSAGAEVSKVPADTETGVAQVAGNATAAIATGAQEANSASKGTHTGTKAVAVLSNDARTRSSQDLNGKQEKQDATTAKTPGTEELPDRIAKKVDDFSVEVVDPDLRRNISGSETGMQVLHAESHYATEIPVEEVDDKDKTLAQAAKEENTPIIPLERSRKKVVTGAQQELQAGISAFGFVAQEQTRKAVQAEALAREVNEQGRAEAKAREQAEMAKMQVAKAEAPLSVAPAESDAATAPESTRDAVIATQTQNKKSESLPENSKESQSLEKPESADAPQATSITVAELERLFPMPAAPKPNNTKESTGNVDLRANAGVYHVRSGIGTYRIGVELFKPNQGYSQDQLMTALYRRNPDKFGARGPLYPFNEVDLVIPTVEQIKLERDGVYCQYLAKNGVRLSVSQLPPRGSTSDDAYVADLKKYQTQCKKIEFKRQEYLSAKGLKLVKAENSLKK